MKLPDLRGRILFWIVLAAALACLAAGQRSPGFKVWSAVFAIAALASWAVGPRLKWDWLPAAFLTVYTSAAAGSLLAGASFAWMAAGQAAALAVFELADDAPGLDINTTLRRRFLTQRGLLLGGAVGMGLVAAVLASRLDFEVSFGGMGLAALAVLFGLSRLAGLFREE